MGYFDNKASMDERNDESGMELLELKLNEKLNSKITI